MSLDKYEELMTLKEIAEVLNVSKQTIKKMEKRGEFPLFHIKINTRGDRRYWKKDIETYLEELEKGKR